MRKFLTILMAGTGILLVSGCNKAAPTGQVIATVNGEDVTRQDLNDAIQQLKIPSNADKGVVQNSVLAQLVNQRLMVQSAKSQGLDKSPQYLSAVRRANDQILASLLGKKIVSGVQPAASVQIDDYITANPQRFADRTIYQLEQVRAPAGAAGAWLKDARSLDGIMTKLSADGVRFMHGNAQMDGGAVPQQYLDIITKLPPGEPFVTAQSGMMIASVVTGKTPQPILGNEARTVAATMIRQEAERKTVVGWLKSLNDTAKIKYEQGFGPPPAANGDGAIAAPIKAPVSAPPVAPPPPHARPRVPAPKLE